MAEVSFGMWSFWNDIGKALAVIVAAVLAGAMLIIVGGF